MDLFEYDANLKVLICRLCQHGVSPKIIKAHLQRKHDLRSKNGADLVIRRLLSNPVVVFLNPPQQESKRPASNGNALSLLNVHEGFLKCKKCPKIHCDARGVVRQLRTVHETIRRGAGRSSLSSRTQELD